MRVPDRVMSIEGNTRLSATFTIENDPRNCGSLNSSKITSSMREPVSISAVAMIVRDPPSSILRAFEKPLRPLALASTPPVRTLPEEGTTVL